MVEPTEDSTDPVGDEPIEALIEFTMDGDRESDAQDPEFVPEHSSEGEFLTTEELQTLGDVLGHASEFPGEHEVELVGSGQPEWGSVQTQLSGLRTTVEELRTNTLEMSALQPLLAEIKAEVEVGHHRRDILTSSLSSLSGDMHEMRLQLSAATKSAMESAASLKDMHQQLSQQPGVRVVASPRDLAWPILFVGFGLLPVSWAVAFYLKTGDLRMTLAGLVAANLVSCATIFASGTRKWL